MRQIARLSLLAIAMALYAALAQGTASASTWSWSTVERPAAAVAGERVVSVRVRVEAGLTVTPDAIATVVGDILGDERGWIGLENVVFQIVADVENPDLLVTVASPATTDQLCLPLNTVGKLSCRRGGQVILNVDRWSRGPDVYHDSYLGEIDEYRRYLVNHEVGHFLGKGHVTPANCSLEVRAPVMMQQTFGLNGCAINGWPSLDNGPAEAAAKEFGSLTRALDRRPLISPWKFTRNPLRA